MAVTFNITDIRIYSIHYTVKHIQPPSDPNITVKADFKYQGFHDEAQKEFRSLFGASIYGETLPYSLDVEIIGTFLFESPPNKEEKQMFIQVTCPTILFPYLREIVSDVIQRAGYPAFYLQPINFYNIYVSSPIKQPVTEGQE